MVARACGKFIGPPNVRIGKFQRINVQAPHHVPQAHRPAFVHFPGHLLGPGFPLASMATGAWQARVDVYQCI
jgi:hypothetical protein